MDQREHWIFLRGLVREKGHWHDFVQRFQQARPLASLELIDTQGNGEFYQQTSPLAIRAQMEFVRGQSQAAARRQKVHLLAVSMGAMIATEWMLRYPQEIARAVLISNSLAATSRFYHRLRPSALGKLVQGALLGKLAARERFIVKLEFTLRRDLNDLVSENVRLAKAHPVRPANAVRQLLACLRYGGSAMRPQAPVLLLSGRGDQIMNPVCARDLAERWQVPHFEHPLAGHDVAVDDAGWVLNQIENFLRTEPSRT